MSLLCVDKLGVSRNQQVVLEAVSLTVEPGEFIGLIGPNGAGKSTLLQAILHQVAYQGTILLDGHNNQQLSDSARALLLSYIAQNREISWNMTVETLVMLGRRTGLPPFARLSDQNHQQLATIMTRLQLHPLAKRPVHALSGGEQARVLIARALMQDARLLLADEPVAGLDPAHQISLMQILASHAAKGGTILCTLHDLSLAARWCTRLILLKQGKIIADGKPAEILSAEILRRLYGVEVFRALTTDGLIIQPTAIAE